MRITPECFDICFCERWYYKINYKYERCKHTKTKSCYKNISCWFICSSIFSFFLLCGDLKFDLMFFIQLIWWIRACQIFKTFDQAKMLQILLHTLTNLFDSANLIKLIWPCISGDMSIVDWFKWLCYFRFLLKNSFGKPFCQILFFSQSFYLFCVIPCYFLKKAILFWFSVITKFTLVTLVFTCCCFEHQVFLPLDYVLLL